MPVRLGPLCSLPRKTAASLSICGIAALTASVATAKAHCAFIEQENQSHQVHRGNGTAVWRRRH